MAKMYVPGTKWGHLLVCSKVIFNEKWEAISRLILGNIYLVEETGGKVNMLAKVVDDKERCEILGREFGIHITAQELRRGMRTWSPNL